MRNWIVTLLVTVIASPGWACTTVSIPQSQTKVVGKSYDWSMGQGMAVVNKRHMAKTALPFMQGDNPITWTSQFGSVTFNQYGREFPNGGINEKGLMVEIMWLDSSVYPVVDGSKTINELQWIQYVLDNFSSVDEVVKAMPALRVSKVYAPVHYMSCDRSAKCATFEYVDGKLVVHAGKDIFVNTLTNDTYSDSVAYLKTILGFGGKTALEPGPGSLPRFARASAMAQVYRDGMGETATEYAFRVLAAVAQPDDYSKWNIVYATETGDVSFRTVDSKDIKSVATSKFDFSCKRPVLTFDMNKNEGGDVSAKFVEYSREANRKLIEQGVKDLLPFLPPGTLDKLAAYSETGRCTE